MQYRTAMIQASLGINEPWKCYGVQAVVFNMNADSTFLKEYYSNDNDFNVLSLFAGYFESRFSSDNTIKVAENTALSFTSFIIKKDGFKAFLECKSTNDYANDWLSSIGVQKKYSEKYNLEAYVDSQYSYSEDFPLIFVNDNETINFSYVKDYIESAEDIMRMLEEYAIAKNEILNYIKEQAPNCSKAVLANNSNPVFIFIQEESYGRRGRNINVEPNLSILMYHYVGLMLPPNNFLTKWYNTGLATFLSQKYMPDDVKERYYNSVFTENSDYTEDMRELTGLIREYYTHHKPIPESSIDIDAELMFEAIAIATLTKPDLKSVGGIVSSINGIDLSYPSFSYLPSI